MTQNTKKPLVGRPAEAVSPLPAESVGASRNPDAITGHLEGVDEEGRLLFREDGKMSVLPVAVGVSISDEELLTATALRHRALVVRTNSPSPELVLLGLVRERVTNPSREAGSEEIDAVVDGETVRLKGKRRIDLECGKARIVLHQDGRIELSGTKVLTRSRGAIKLKGATVEIN